MASPKQLVECVAEVLNTPVATVTVHDRNLAMAGLRTVGGRGRAVAEINSLDAANLLLATLASEQVRDSVKSVQLFGSLVCKGSKHLADISPILGGRHTLKEAFAEILNLLSGDMLRHADEFTILAKINLQIQSVELEISIHDTTSQLNYLLMGASNKKTYTGDLKTIKTLTEVTFRTVAAKLRGDDVER